MLNRASKQAALRNESPRSTVYCNRGGVTRAVLGLHRAAPRGSGLFALTGVCQTKSRNGNPERRVGVQG
jgi:hypothetical protein